jgi:aminoglycoside phosphotransferase (APT) family kinase protein
LNAAAIGPAHRAAPEIFTARHAALSRLAIEKWDALLERWYAGPLTLIHGDSHLANCFEYAAPEGPRMGMLDFQGVQWCHGIRDVQYFLITPWIRRRWPRRAADPRLPERTRPVGRRARAR